LKIVAGASMFVLRRLPACLALLLLGALSLRLGAPFLAALPLTFLLLVALFLPWRKVQLGMNGLLWAGALAWVAMLAVRVNARLAEGRPWLRLAAIFVVVSLFTAWSAWMTRQRRQEA
jgi:hypothetical protein